MQMSSNQPYLLRAFYDWIVDNNLTPYIVVDATVEGTQVPEEHIKNGQIVLNISPSACAKLHLGNVDITFEARFGGVARNLMVPCKAVQAIYARENGAGTVFTVEDDLAADDLEDENFEVSLEPSPEQEPTEAPKPPKKGPPHLKVIK